MGIASTDKLQDGIEVPVDQDPSGTLLASNLSDIEKGRHK